MSEELPEHPDISTRFQRFRLLLWKSYLWHRYYWWWTILEILIRCFVPIFIVYALPNEIKFQQKPASYQIQLSRTALLNTSLHFKYLVYTPSVPFTDKLMNNVADALDHHHLEGQTRIELVKTENETELEAFALNRSFYSNQLPLGVVFLEQGSDNVVPNKLVYKLRESAVLFTNWILPDEGKQNVFIASSGVDENPYWWEGFVAVQLLLNEEFTKMKLNGSSWSTPEIRFQDFPDPETTSRNIERDRNNLLFLVCGAFLLIETALSIPFIASVIGEKRSGAKELMKIYGVEEFFIWLSWFLIESIVVFVWVTLSAILLKIPFKGDGSECILFVEFSVLWTVLILYGISNLSFALFISAIFQQAAVAASVYVLMNFFSLIIGIAMQWMNWRMVLLITCIIPAGNMWQSVLYLYMAEFFGVNFDWPMVKNSRDAESTITFPIHFVFFVCDTIIYAVFALYIGSKSNQREFVQRIRTSEIIFRNEPGTEPVHTIDDSQSSAEWSSFVVHNPTIKDDDDFGEFALINPELTIQIEDLYKDFGYIRALNGINVEFYDHEIGVVLGHKGAGKTTLLSILSGRIPYNRGTIHYKGVDINDDFNVLKHHMGICFEENRLFDYVSVLNHLIFYGILKGLSTSSATDEAEHYLMKMEMQNEEKSKIRNLSESTRRKLSIAISLMGDRQVLLLDEPLVGLDSDAKTVVWNFLMGLRTDHTIVLTSNYEREAEAMADRITILENGTIIDHGSRESLSESIGMHYEISVAGKEANFVAITEIVQRHVNASIQQAAEVEIIYDVPLTESSKFSKLFENLESQDLGISEINLTSNSIEHILIKSGSISADDSLKLPNTSELLEFSYDADSLDEKFSSGFRERLRQMKILFIKKLLYIIRDYKSMLGRIIFPSLIALVIVMILEWVNYDSLVPLKMSLSSFANPSTLLQVTNSNRPIINSFRNYINQEHVALITINSSEDLLESLLNVARKDMIRFRKELIAAFKFETDNLHLILSNPRAHHALPVALTTYSNTLLRNKTGDESMEIITYNHPIPFFNATNSGEDCKRLELHYYTFIVISVLFMLFGYFTIEIVMYLFELSSMEVANSLMHLQIMAGVPVWIYWSTTVVFDLLFFIAVVFVRIALFIVFDNYNKFFEYDFNFDIFLLLIMAFGITGLFCVYIISFLYKREKRSYANLFVFNLTCNLMVPLLLLLLPSSRGEKYFWLRYLFVWFPFLNFPWALSQYVLHWYSNNKCLACSPLIRSYCEIATGKTENKSVLEFPQLDNENAILVDMIFLGITLLLCGLMFILMNLGLIDFVHNFFNSKNKQNPEYDEDVKLERSTIFRVKKGSRPQEVPLLVDGLSKNYIERLKPVTAIEDVSFMAQHGTCFGILKGYNGGKSIVFDMMTAKTIPTKGNVSVEGVEMRSNKKRYFSMVGYCPQTSPLLDKFTGREMLMLIASLKGDRSNIENLVSQWIYASGLDNLQNIRCEYYTHGNKRLLTTILALLGYPKVVYLDEPASGVDFDSRRQLYNVINQIKRSNRTVVLGSPSATECYLLCDRLTILKNGIMHCLGHPHDLRRHYDLGYFVVIKVRSDVMAMREVSILEEYMIHEFGSKPSNLIEHFRGLLEYQILDRSLRLSVLFAKMEHIKENNSIVEEYTVRTTTLEDIFEYFSH